MRALVASCMAICVGVDASAFSLGVTGDVNLNPHLHQGVAPEYIWGDLIRVTQSVGLMAIQHEGTVAEVYDPNPQTIQFEDPLNYTATYAAAGIDFISLANNHQFDYGWHAVSRTLAALQQTGIAYGGLGKTAEAVRRPAVVPAQSQGANTVDVAFFTLVIDECWRWPNGTLYLDGCTCGASANPARTPPYQCYPAGAGNPQGLWYRFNITDEFIKEVTSTIGAYKQAHPHTLVVCYLHVGPNFQWVPYAEHEHLLRNVSRAADLVWGTSSHHIQRFEVFEGTPIIYGLGDFLFRHVVGVDDWCPLYARPCSQYRPELSVMYIFDVVVSPAGRPSISLDNITAIGTRHNGNCTAIATAPDDVAWIASTFGKQAVNAKLTPEARPGWYKVVVARDQRTAS